MYYRKAQGWMKHADFILLDVICLHIAFVLAYISRHGSSNPYADPFYANAAIVYTLVDVLVLIVNRTMKNVLRRGFYKEFAQTVKHIFLVSLLMTMFLFSAQEGEEFSRITFFLQAIYYTVISYGVRLLWKRFLRSRKGGLMATAIYLISTAERAEGVVRRFQTDSASDYLIQGICLLDRDAVGETLLGVPITAARETVVHYLCDKWVDEVYISVPAGKPCPPELISSLSEMGMVIHIEMEHLQAEEWQHQVVEKVAGATVRTLSMTMATPSQLILKRTLDIVGGIVGCLLTGLLTLVIGPMIFIQSPGPIFFSQVRVGKNGKKFKLYKFRSMYPDAEERKAELMRENRIKDGMMFKLDFDPRIIGCKKLPDGTVKKGIGNFIREWSLDEFPQFFNVLKGDLSLCGTRPPTVDEWEKYDLHHRARLAIKPGITGLWQISGRSSITDFEQVVELDKKYIREWSMGLDFRILLQTVKVVLRRDGSM